MNFGGTALRAQSNEAPFASGSNKQTSEVSTMNALPSGLNMHDAGTKLCSVVTNKPAVGITPKCTED